MSRASFALAVLLVVSSCSQLYAQSLTEEDFLENALENHPAIAAAEADRASADGIRRQAGIVDNPVLSWEREDPASILRQDTWSLGWRLPFDGRKHRIAAGDAAVGAADSDIDATRFGIRLEMRTLYAAWYVAAQREAVLEGHFERTGRLARWLRARAESGEAAGVEADRLDLEAEVLERQLAAARAETRAFRASASVWSTLVTGETWPRRPFLPEPPSAVDVSSRPEIEAMVHRVAEAEAVHRLNKRVLEPPEITLGWTEIGEENLKVDGPVFGLSWPLPIFDRNRGNRDAAAARETSARALLEVEIRRAKEEAAAALASYSDLYGVANSTGDLTAESDVAGAVFAAFEAGEAGLTDVLDTLRASVAVELARLDSLQQALAAERELEAAIGRAILPGGSS